MTARFVASYFLTGQGGVVTMRATVHVEGCAVLDRARREVDNPPARIQRPAVVEEQRYRQLILTAALVEPVEHRCCKKGPSDDRQAPQPLQFAC